MSIIFSADKIYFDELGVGISSGINQDNGFYWDIQPGMTVDGVVGVSLTSAYVATELLSIDMVVGIDEKENSAKFIDLMQLVPEKFRSSVILQQFLAEAGLQAGIWLGDIDDIQYLIDVYSVGDTYIQNLADLIGLTFVVNADTTLEDKRRQLINAVDWYKMKGTYKIFSNIGYSLGLPLNIYDLYTNNYTSFVRENWFVGNVNENPGGLNSSYYKSPHIAIDIFLNKVRGTSSSGSSTYLFIEDDFIDLTSYVEKVRPVNVVPHYSILLNPVTDQSGVAITVSGDIKTASIPPWNLVKNYFDDSGTVSGGVNRFNHSSLFFDYSNSAYLQAIVKWKLGTGNKGVSPDDSGFTLQHVVLSGSVDTVTLYSDRVEYLFELPNTITQTGLSELGLFLTDNTTLKIASTFPDIDLVSGITLRVLVKLYFNNI